MKKLLAGLAVLLTASITRCFAVHGFDRRRHGAGHAASFGADADSTS